MGIRFSMDGDVNLSVKSVIRCDLRVESEQNSIAKSNDVSCKLFVVGQIDGSNTKNIAALEKIAEWAKACNQKENSYKNVVVEQNYAEIFRRVITFPEARVLSFREVFLTDNSKFLQIAMEIEQKESKQNEISILYF